MGVFNCDVIRQTTSSMFSDVQDQNNIDLVIKTILEQKMFYPMYPPSVETPIDYAQIEHMYLHETPDILIIPSRFIK